MHKIPNLLATPDLFLFGLTVRQGLMLLVGGGTGYLLFLHIFALFADPTLALLAGLCAALLFLGLTLALAFLQRGGRGMEEWGMVLLLYLARPRIYSWRPGLPARESARRWSVPASTLRRQRTRTEEQPW
ncbi:MAG TPA: hypothetical protein VGF67_04680 [Ktedonobacteraceae bacterium]|jgi:hypothetical protein